MQKGDFVYVKAGDLKSRGVRVTKVNTDDTVEIDDGAGVKARVPISQIEVRNSVQELKVATKHDDNKNRLDLIPVAGIEAAGRAFTFGAKKYNDHNWSKGFAYSRLLGASLRHIFAYVRGQDKDPESGLSHIDHALACLMMLAAHETEGLGNDDRRKTKY